MTSLEERNQKIIDAIIEKANVGCPGSLAMIGIYGSFMTEDIHAKSDLDLLILINDDKGWQLGCGFIQDDLQVGHDIYCTTWDGLRNDARYEHPNISKLMDSKIVYCADEKYMEELEALRKQVREKLSAPLTAEDYEKAESTLKEAEHCYTMAMISESRSELLKWAGGVIYFVENAIALLNKQYFRCGVKRAYEELEAMKSRPEKLCELIENVISALSVDKAKEHLTILLRETVTTFQKVKESIPGKQKAATAENLWGTYEEMYSNWRNKMYLAAETGNRYLAFMSLISLDGMFSEISDEVDINEYDALKAYDLQDLYKTAKAFDDVIQEYLQEYRKVELEIVHYPDVDAFVREYCEKM